MKICTKCGETKPLDCFGTDKRRPHGRMARCKDCKRQEQALFRKNAEGYHKRRYWLRPEAERERHLVRKYGVTLIRYNEMFKAQGGACAICRKTQDRAFDVDHDHATGRVRGLLCTNCNRMIGHAADDPNRLRAAAGYLEQEAIAPQAAAEFIRACA